MARAPTKHGRDETLDFQGFLNDLQDWELSLKDKDKDKKLKAQSSDKEISVSSSQKIGTAGKGRKPAGKLSTVDYSSSSMPYDYSRKYDEINKMSSSSISDDSYEDAASEKELGNEYFKQKKFKEAIDCYSRSIALSPTAVAYANRAMAYLKLKRFQEAEDDCTEALNMDDRYIKAYSRRATARKELGKHKECIDDAEFALRLEPNNQEIKKQYSEAKSLYEKVTLNKVSVALENTVQKMQKVEKKDTKVTSPGFQPVESATQIQAAVAQDYTKTNQVAKKREPKAAVQELASRAASLAMNGTAKNITPPTSAYQFEVSWRGLSGDRALQASLLKAVSPGALPQIFKNSLTVPILVDIVRCIASFFSEEMDLAVSFLENLTKVPRFDMLVMCIPSTDRADLVKIWNEVFCNEAIPIEHAEKLDNMRSKYCLMR